MRQLPQWRYPSHTGGSSLTLPLQPSSSLFSLSLSLLFSLNLHYYTLTSCNIGEKMKAILNICVPNIQQPTRTACYDSICSRDKSWSRVSILAWGGASNGPNMTNLNCMFFSANMIIGRRVKIRVILNQILTRRDTQTLCFLTIFNRRSDKYK